MIFLVVYLNQILQHSFLSIFIAWKYLVRLYHSLSVLERSHTSKWVVTSLFIGSIEICLMRHLSCTAVCCVCVCECVCADVEVGWQRVKCSLSAIKIRQTSEVLKTVDSSVWVLMCTWVSCVRWYLSGGSHFHSFWKLKLIAPAEKLWSDFMHEVSRHRLALSSIILFFVRFGRSEADRWKAERVLDGSSPRAEELLWESFAKEHQQQHGLLFISTLLFFIFGVASSSKVRTCSVVSCQI